MIEGGYSDEEVEILNKLEEARKLVEAGWKAAIECYVHHGMAGWSIYGEGYKESAMNDVLGP